MIAFATWMKPENVPRGRSQSQKPRLHDSFAVNVQKRQTHRDRKSTGGCRPSRDGGSREQGITANGYGVFFFG